MTANNQCYQPPFSSPEEEISYLKRKISFLLQHIETLADYEIDLHQPARIDDQLTELRNIQNSRSWRITRPLRELSGIMRRIVRFIHKCKAKYYG